MYKLGKTITRIGFTGALLTVSIMLAEVESSRIILLAMAKNAKQMMQYEWKQRITVTRKGRPSEPIVDQVRFDSSGHLQRTTISAPEQKQMGGIRGRVAANVKENVKDIMELAGRYNKPQQLVEAIKKSEISAGPGTNSTQLRATNLLEPTDSMTMLLNPQTHLATHADIQTQYEGSAMTVAQEYSPIPGGPNVMRNMKVSVPDKGLSVNVDSYDFVRQSAGSMQ